MSEDTFFQRTKRKTITFFKRLLLILVLALLAFLAFAYWGTVESGVIAGRVLKISEKGLLFKTYEGRLSLESSNRAGSLSETFDFSVAAKDSLVIHTLQEAALNSERVNLHYSKHYMKFFWRGESKYFATQAEFNTD